MSAKHLIVGLGNPGKKYQNTRHNIGFLVIDELVARFSLGAGRSERRAITWDGQIDGKRVKLAKPLTYMNRSGESLRQLMDYYDIDLSNLIVIHDDLDTDFGVLRLRRNGGHGGQNGLRSIIQHLASKDFARLRFGIGRPPGRMDPVAYVLQPFRGDDVVRAAELAGRAADAVEVWLSEGIEVAMTRFNGEASGAGKQVSSAELRQQLAACLRAHELAPSDHKPLTKAIALQKKLGLVDAAVANHLKLADVYNKAGNARLAIAEQVKAVSIQPSLVDQQRAIADWYLARENKKKAVSRLLILAAYLGDQGDKLAALREVERALSINPQHPKALDMRDKFDAAVSSR